MRSIIDLIEEAVEHDDYKLMINLLIYGCMGEPDDTDDIKASKKEKLNTIREWIKEEKYPINKREYFEKLDGKIERILND